MIRLFQNGTVNFWLTNRIPRRALTRFAGWFSRIENPVVAKLSIVVWRRFADLDLREARQTRFRSLHECFIRQLKDGARPVDPDAGTITSPCDAVVMAAGVIDDATLFQVKGITYGLPALLNDRALMQMYRGGRFATLRLKSSMYHRFHAPHDCRVHRVRYIPGDLWNVNHAAVRRIDRLYCRNERAVIPLRIDTLDETVTLVPVGAVLVGSIHLNFVEDLLNIDYRGPRSIPCNASFAKGQELGYFHLGSTIIVLASGRLDLHDGIRPDTLLRVGDAVFTKRR